MAPVELRDILTEDDDESGRLVGFVMISDGILRDVLDASEGIVGPYGEQVLRLDLGQTRARA
jgi:hypothetical protein